MNYKKKKPLDANMREALHLLCVGVMFLGPIFLYFVFALSRAAWYIKLGGAAVAVYSWFGCGLSMYEARKSRNDGKHFTSTEVHFEDAGAVAQYFRRHNMDEGAIQAFVEDAVREKTWKEQEGEYVDVQEKGQ